ncbi:biopolymer transporter ExbD [Pendulispora brunnea]|uniref:Biopolymer transporter ExbD n=1 Tax=Pendulispora brunnea TaxID=2905690 RepID=A0ABZ2K460_9BACT
MQRPTRSGKRTHVSRVLAAAACAFSLSACDGARKPSPVEATGDPDALHVYVGRDGVTFIQGEPLLTDAKILTRAEEFHAKNPHGRVVVQSHEAAVHGRTVRVLDLLKEAEIQYVAVGVRPQSR